MTTSESYNRLKSEKSAYLKQHKDNPVHWYPYGEEALQRAEHEQKPLFISIGYSSCHWCHVMAHESFENDKIASILNEKFINIKIDREEYPDIDGYFQKACMAVTGRGGWPLSVFATPDMKAFYVGTYFPPEPREGMPSFTEVIQKISQAYATDKDNVIKNCEEIHKMITAPHQVGERVDFEGHFPSPHQIVSVVDSYIDKKNGGFGKAPKFPNFSFYEFTIEQALEGVLPESEAKIFLESLEKMLMGGIYDHARGGIHRYSVDEKWEVPHFEKMLYDQSGLLRVLAKASILMPSPLFFDALIQTMDYLESEMLSEKGYFFSAQDADSEGKEGLYFTYSKEEFEAAVMNHDLKLEERLDDFYQWFKISEEGNFESKLNTIQLSHEHRETFFNPEEWSLVREVRAALLDDRKSRIPPMTDNKGIASWNFMLLSSLIDVYQYSKIDVIKAKAADLINKSVEGIHQSFISMDESKNDGMAQIKHSTTLNTNIPYFEDFVSFAESSIRLYEFSGNPDFLDNFERTLEFIFKEFFKDDQFYTRGISFNESERYENLPVGIFDMSFKSSLGTLISLVRKSQVLNLENDFVQDINKTMDMVIHTVLKNPLASGESMRALVYPDEVYKKVEIPKAFLNEEKFHMFLPFFSSRFLLKYTAAEKDWQICNNRECEFKGSGIDEFFETFSHNEPKS